MKQRILAAFLALALSLGLIATAATAMAFSDVTDASVSETVSVLQSMGIVDGYSDGSYHPGDTLTRAQFCKLAILLEGHGDQVTANSYRTLFSDISSSHWALGYVNLAYSEGLVAGYGDGRFGPDDSVTAAQAVTILLHILGYENSEIGPFWPEDYLAKAAKLGITDGVSTAGSAALTRGQAAQLLYATLKQDTAGGKDYLSTWASSSLESAVLLDNDAESEDGRTGTAEIYANGSVTYYDQSRTMAAGLTGRRGTLLLNKSGQVDGFVPDDNTYKVLTVSSVDADGITSASGSSYDIASSIPVLSDGEKQTWGDSWYDMDGRNTAILYYSQAGDIDLVFFSDSELYDGVLLTGYYENAVPNTSSPTSITLLGHTFTVADGARSALSKFSVGERITVALNGEGEVAVAYSTSDKQAQMIGILTSAGNSSAKATLLSGIDVSGTLSSSATTASGLVGGLVLVRSSGIGKLSVSSLSGSSASSKWNVGQGTIGTLTVSSQVRIYDQVNGSAVAEVDLDNLVLDTVPASSISYVGTDSSGQVNLLVLNDVTGDCYTYGFLEKGTESGGSGDLKYTNNTVAVTNSAGTGSAYLVGAAVTDGAAGGVAATSAGKAAGVVYLTKVTGVSRSDFTGTESVLADGYHIPISDEVEVYNDASDQWTTLSAAKAFSDSFTVYYDKTPSTGGQIRLIVAESST